MDTEAMKQATPKATREDMVDTELAIKTMATSSSIPPSRTSSLEPREVTDLQELLEQREAMEQDSAKAE